MLGTLQIHNFDSVVVILLVRFIEYDGQSKVHMYGQIYAMGTCVCKLEIFDDSFSSCQQSTQTHHKSTSPGIPKTFEYNK